MNIRKFIPAFGWFSKYKRAYLKGDLVAGITVGVMLIPQGMAYAMIAGLPPIYGLYASTIPLLIYALLGTSRQLAVGPVAMVSLLTAAGIGVLAEAGSTTYISLAIILALMVGVIQFLLGVFRLGFLVNFLSHPVISGFTSAAALIIGLSQLKHLLGIDIPRSHHVHEIIGHAIADFGSVNWATVGIGITGIGLIVVVKKIAKTIPGPLLAVVFGVLAVWFFELTNMGVKIVGEVPSGLPVFGLPEFSFETIKMLFPIALAISLVSFMESIAVAKAIQAKHKDYKVSPNQELIALGAANVGGAFFQSYPVTGGFSRTAVNDQTGAKTGFASIISALLILLTLLFLTPLFYYLPNAILASVIMVAVFGLIDVKEAKHLWHADRSDFWMLAITFFATLALGIEQGIGIGVVLSLAWIIFRSTRPHIAVLGRVKDSTFYRNINRFKNLEIRKDLLIVRFDEQIYFANSNYFREQIEHLAFAKKDLKAIVFCFNSVSEIDSSAGQMLEDLIDDFKNQGWKIYFTGVRGPVRDTLERIGLTKKIGEENFFMSIQEAINCFDHPSHKENLEEFKKFTLQTNE